MADASVAATAVGGAIGIIAATVPLVIAAVREGRRAERDRRERLAQERHQACVRLLSTVLGLRVRVENAQVDHGEGLAARLAEIRQCAAEARVEAVGITPMVPADLAGSGKRLAEAAYRLAATVTANTKLQLHGSPEPPDFSELDECVDDFEKFARSTLAGPGAAPARDGAGTAVGRWRRPRAWPVPLRRSRRR
jgi:hypothetical protein